MKKVKRLNHTGCFGIREDQKLMLSLQGRVFNSETDEIKDTCPGKSKADKHRHLEKVMSAGRGHPGHIR